MTRLMRHFFLTAANLHHMINSFPSAYEAFAYDAIQMLLLLLLLLLLLSLLLSSSS